MKNAILLSFLLIVSTSFLTVQSQSPQWMNWVYSDRVHDMAETSQSIWVGTDGGLVEIDKNRGLTKIYNRANSDIPHNKVRSLAVDSDENVWIGTEIDCYDGSDNCFGGITKFDGENWSSHHYKTTEPNLGSFFITDIESDGFGNIWFIERTFSYYSNVVNIYESKIIKFDEANATFSVFNQEDIGAHHFTDFIDLATENGNVWLTSTFGIFYYNTIEWQHFTEENTSLTGNIFSEVKIDSKGNKWFGIYEYESCPTGDYTGPSPRGTVKFDGEKWTKYEEGFYLNYEEQSVENDLLTIDKNDNIWKITTHRSHFSNWGREGFFVQFDGNNWESEIFEDLDYGHIYFTYFDQQNNLWLSTDENPLIKRDAATSQWENYTISNIPFWASTYPDFTFDKENNLYSVDRENLYWLKDGTWNSIAINSSVHTLVNSVFFDSNNIAWVALTYDHNKPSRQAALLRIEDDEIETFEIGENIRIGGAKIDDNDKIWLYDGYGGDIYTYQNAVLELDTNFQNISNAVFSEYSNKGYGSFLIDGVNHLWLIGNASNGYYDSKKRALFHFNGEVWNFVEIPEIMINTNYISPSLQKYGDKIWLQWEDNILTYHQEEGWDSSILTTAPWKDLNISSMVFQNNGTQWGIQQNYYQHLHPKTGFLHSIDEELNVTTYSYPNSGIAGRSSLNLKVDDKQNIWMNSYFDGLTIFNPNGIEGIEVMNVIENPRVTNEITNIESEYSDFSIVFYPNPTRGQLNFDIGFPLTKDSKIQLLDIGGKIVKEWSNPIIERKVLDLSEMSEGIYFLYFQSNNTSIFEKVIISRN